MCKKRLHHKDLEFYHGLMDTMTLLIQQLESVDLTCDEIKVSLLDRAKKLQGSIYGEIYLCQKAINE